MPPAPPTGNGFSIADDRLPSPNNGSTWTSNQHPLKLQVTAAPD